jgi:lipoprotein NlpD
MTPRITLALLTCISLILAACTTTNPAPVIDRSARPSPPPLAPVPAPIETRAAPPATSSIPATPSSSGVTIGTAPPSTINERSAPPSTLPPISGSQPGNTPGSAFHVVQRGETLYRIAVNNNVNVDSLAAWNNLNPVAPNIREGQVLRLRPPESTVGTVGTVGDGRSAPASTGAPSAPLVVQSDGTLLPSTPITPVVPWQPNVPIKTEPRAQRVPYTDSALTQMQRSETPVIGPTGTGVAVPGGAATPVVAGRTPTESAPGAAAAVAASSTTALAGEPEVKPGNGVDRDGVNWTWPTTGRLASKWNDRAAMKGVDIAAKSGTPVVAAAAGKVIYVGKEPRGYGQMIVVSHAKETVTVYFHTDKVLVKEQQRVTLGQRIAEVSETSGNKIHFEVRKQGRPLDPLTLMPAR